MLSAWHAALLNNQAAPGIIKAQQDQIYSLFDTYVDAGLRWVRKHGKEYIPSVDNNLTTSLTMILQVSGAAARLMVTLRCGAGLLPQRDSVS